MPRNLFAEAPKPNAPRNLFAAPEAPVDPFEGKSTEQLLQTIEGGVDPEQEAMISDEISRRELGRKVEDFHTPITGKENIAAIESAILDAPGGKVASEAAAGINRGVAKLVDALGVDPANEILNLLDIDAQIPKVQETAPFRGNFMEEGIAKDVVRGASEAVPAALGVTQLARGAASLAQPGVAQGVFQQIGSLAPGVDASLGALSGAGQVIGQEIGGDTGAMIGSVTAPLVGSGIATGVAKSVTKLRNAIKGNWGDAELQQLKDLAKAEGIDISFADVTKNNLARKVDVALESFGSLGTAAFRTKQGNQAKNAAERFLDSFKSTTDDAPRAIQESLLRYTKGVAGKSSDMYTSLFDELTKKGATGKLLNARNYARNAIEDEKQMQQFAKSGLVNELELYAKGGEFGGEQLKTIRSRLLGELRALKADATITKEAVKPLEGLVKAVDFDLGRTMIKNGLSKEWRAANKYYKDVVVPTQAREIVSAAKTDKPDEIFKAFIRNDLKGAGADRAKQLFKNLDDEGRAAVQYSMVDNAFQKALVSSETGVVFSPARFAGEMNRMSNASGVFFRGDEAKRLEGFKRIMGAITRAGQFAENPPTGNRLFVPLAIGGATVEPTTAAGVGVGATVAKILFTTERGKNLLLASSKLKKDSPALEAIGKSLLTLQDEQ